MRPNLMENGSAKRLFVGSRLRSRLRNSENCVFGWGKSSLGVLPKPNWNSKAVWTQFGAVTEAFFQHLNWFCYHFGASTRLQIAFRVDMPGREPPVVLELE